MKHKLERCFVGGGFWVCELCEAEFTYEDDLKAWVFKVWNTRKDGMVNMKAFKKLNNAFRWHSSKDALKGLTK